MVSYVHVVLPDGTPASSAPRTCMSSISLKSEIPGHGGKQSLPSLGIEHLELPAFESPK